MCCNKHMEYDFRCQVTEVQFIIQITHFCSQRAAIPIIGCSTFDVLQDYSSWLLLSVFGYAQSTSFHLEHTASRIVITYHL